MLQKKKQIPVTVRYHFKSNLASAYCSPPVLLSLGSLTRDPFNPCNLFHPHDPLHPRDPFHFRDPFYPRDPFHPSRTLPPLSRPLPTLATPFTPVTPSTPSMFLDLLVAVGSVLRSRPEPGPFGRSRCEGPAPAPY